MLTDEIWLDPFERSHAGRHGAFLVRVNPEHVEHSVQRIRQRRIEEVQVHFGGPLQVVESKRRAA